GSKACKAQCSETAWTKSVKCCPWVNTCKDGTCAASCRCIPACTSPTPDCCNGVCTNLNGSDPKNCGACGVETIICCQGSPCGQTQVCGSGGCQNCPAGQEGRNGVCVCSATGQPACGAAGVCCGA